MDPQIKKLILDNVPADGSNIGNIRLIETVLAQAKAAGHRIKESAVEAVREGLIEEGTLGRGKGRGGSVFLARPSEANDFALAQPTVPQTAEAPKAPKAPAKPAAAAVRANPNDTAQIVSYRHSDKRRNNPEVGMVTPATDPEEGKTRWCYDPHIDPALQFDFGRAQVEKLIDDALGSGDEATMRAALEELKRYSGPYLTWSGKLERITFAVPWRRSAHKPTCHNGGLL